MASWFFCSCRDRRYILCSAYDDLIKKYCNIYIEWCRRIPAMCRSLLFQLLQYVFTMSLFFAPLFASTLFWLNLNVVMRYLWSQCVMLKSIWCASMEYYNYRDDMCFINNFMSSTCHSHSPYSSVFSSPLLSYCWHFNIFYVQLNICLCEWTLVFAIFALKYVRSASV